MKPPQLDSRNFKDLIEKFKKMAPHYTREWQFTDPQTSSSYEPGSALSAIFFEQFLGNIGRMNQVPEKYFTDFLNSLGVAQLPSKPAETFISFQLVDGAGGSVHIPKGTELLAEHKEDKIGYQTAEELVVSAATPVCLLKTSANAEQWIVQAEEVSYPQMTLFKKEENEENLQKHVLYLGHSKLFQFGSQEHMEVYFEIGKQPGRLEHIQDLNDKLQWEYMVDNKWVAFQEVEVHLHEHQLIFRIKKNEHVDMIESMIGGYTSRWIRCMAIRNDDHVLADLRLRNVELKHAFIGAVKPDNLFINEKEPAKEGFYPFGYDLHTSSVCYVSSQQALPGSQVSVSFQLDYHFLKNPYYVPRPNRLKRKWMIKKVSTAWESPIASTVWEYWNGAFWSRLDPVRIQKHNDLDQHENANLFAFQGEEQRSYWIGEVSAAFRCPEDLQPTQVNGQSNFWFRMRIDQIADSFKDKEFYFNPFIHALNLDIEYERTDKPEFVFLEQDLQLRIVGTLSGSNDDYLFKRDQRFETLYEDQALYVGWNRPLDVDPVHLFVTVYNQTIRGIRKLEWQYLKEQDDEVMWKKIDNLRDDTREFTEDQVIIIPSLSDMARFELFGKQHYWIRIVSRSSDSLQDSSCPVLKSIHTNTVKVIQQRTITGEYPIKQDTDSNELYLLSQKPVQDANVWVNETGSMLPNEIESIPTDNIQIYHDSVGNVQEVWVRWKRMNHLFHSGPHDRHYCLDSSTGTIRFGNGVKGKAPIAGADRIKVDYVTNSGAKGNLPIGAVSKLHQSIAFIDKVYNPVLASGGIDTETETDAKKRGPYLLRHRNQAVTAEDFEWLARQAYPDLARVKCFMTATSGNHVYEHPKVTVAFLANRHEESKPWMPEIKRTIQRYLQERCSIQLVDQLTVEAVSLLPVSVHVQVTGRSQGISGELHDRIAKFLHPIYGGIENKGWAMNKEVHKLDIDVLLSNMDDIESYQVREIRYDKSSVGPYFVICSGKHSVHGNVRSEEGMKGYA